MIPALPNVGGTELLVLLVVVLLFFGAKRIPQLARSLGTGTREFRKGICGAYDQDGANNEDTSRDYEGPPPTGSAPVTEHAPKTE